MLKPRYNIDLSVFPKKALRINTLKANEEEIIKKLKKEGVKLEKISFLKNGYFYDSSFSLASSPEYLQGYIYLQDGASQAVAEILNPSKDDLVLDMAASPGSKTTHLAQLMKNKGLIIALDVKKSRLDTLESNIERLSIKNVITINKDAKFCSDLGLEFEKILLDAPCSGNYCVEKNYYVKRNLEDIKGRAKLQKELVKEAFKVLKKGGCLVYSTCSFEFEENEEVIKYALTLGLKLEEIKGISSNSELEGTLRLWPSKHFVSPFFIARLRK